MKICHLLFNSYGKFAAPFEYTKSLAKLNQHVTVLCTAIEPWVSSKDRRGLNIRRVKIAHGRKRSLANNLRFVIRSASFLKDNEFDIIHVYHFRLAFLLVILQWSKRKNFFLDVRTKNVSGRKSAWIHDGITYLESLFFKNKIAITSAVGETVFRRANFNILPLGANFNVFRINKNYKFRETLGFNKTHVVLITHGTLTTNRNQIQLVKDFAKIVVQYPFLRLLIVGDGDDFQNMAHYVERQQLKKFIILTGAIAYSEIADYINASDIGVAYIPQRNHFETQPPLKTVEYLACGKPVVATNTIGNQFFVNDENGVLIDENCFSEGLAVITKKYKDYSPKQIRKSIKHYNYDDIVNRILYHIYCSKLSSAKGSKS